MIAYLVVEDHHAYKIWCPDRTVKEKAGKKGNSSNFLWIFGFRPDKTVVFSTEGYAPPPDPPAGRREEGVPDVALPPGPPARSPEPPGGGGGEMRGGLPSNFSTENFNSRVGHLPKGRKIRLDSRVLMRYVYSRQYSERVARRRSAVNRRIREERERSCFPYAGPGPTSYSCLRR